MSVEKRPAHVALLCTALTCALVVGTTPLSAWGSSCTKDACAFAKTADQLSDSIDQLAEEGIVDEDSLIITYEKGEQAANLIDEAGVEGSCETLANSTATVQLASGEDLQQAADVLAQQDGIKSVQPNYVYTVQSTQVNDALEAASYQDANMCLNQAWDLSRGDGTAGSGTTVTVAMLDTGLNYEEDLRQEDLQDVSNGGNVYYDYGYNAVDKTLFSENCWHGKVKTAFGTKTSSTAKTYRDYMGHGTATASVIAATANNETGIAGASYNARILPINVFSQPVADQSEGAGICSFSSECLTSNVIAAYDYVLKEASTLNIKVINMSFGGYGYEYDDSILQSRINTAYSAGIVSVASGGNEGESAAYANGTVPCYPAALDNVIGVSATNSKHVVASWSNHNSSIDVCAPGTNLQAARGGWLYSMEDRALYAVGTSTAVSKYTTADGTSFSAPLVSAVLALEYAANSSLTASQATGALLYTSMDMGTSGYDQYYGWGEVNAWHAVLAAKSGQCSKTHYTKSQVATTKAATYSTLAKRTFTCTACSGYKYAYTSGTSYKRVTIKKLTAKKRSFAVKWAKSGTVSGYKVYYHKVGAKSWKVKNVSAKKLSTTVKGLKRHTRYRVRVRAYTVVNGKTVFSRYSTIKTVKTT